MIPAAELADLRTTQTQALPDVGTVMRATLSSDGQGYYDETWGTLGTLACRIYPMRRNPSENTSGAAQMISETPWWATLAYGTLALAVTAKDRIQVGSRTWEIVAVNQNESWQTAVRCEVVAHNQEART